MKAASFSGDSQLRQQPLTATDRLAGMWATAQWRQRHCAVARTARASLLLLLLLLLFALIELPHQARGDGQGGSGLLGGTLATAAKPKRLVYAGATPQASSAIERAALLTFRQSADPTGKALQSWNATVQPNYCSWDGVFCGNDGRVIAIELFQRGLTGTVATSLRALQALAYLDLHRNYMRGGLPPAVAAMSTLTSLELQLNNFTGPIPNDLWRPNLLTFIAYSNNFTGRLSRFMPNATGLRNLKLSYNRMYGAIPEGISRMTALRTFELANNYVVGPIPSGVRSMRSLRSLDLTNNRLTGPIPTELAACSYLERLLVGGNHINGTLPPGLAGLTSLSTLNLSANALTGPLPPAWGRLLGLRSLDLSRNALTGGVPRQWGQLRGLATLALQRNALTGALPGTFSALTGLASLGLGGNLLSMPFPTYVVTMRQLESLDLERSGVSGSLPEGITGLARLSNLNVAVNSITGSIPVGLSALKSLACLDVRNNSLTGGLPAELSRIATLRSVLVAHNVDLGGTLPPWNKSFASLVSINVTNCSMVGPIATTLFDIASLRRFDFSFNFFNGTVPANGMKLVNNYPAVFRANCLLYSDQPPLECAYYPRNGLCYLTGQRPLGQCLPPVPPSPSGVNTARNLGILILVALVCLGVFVATLVVSLAQRQRLRNPCLAGSSEEPWEKMYLEGSDGAVLVADTDLPGMPPEMQRYTMDEVWAATANFSAYLDPEDLRPAFHGRLGRHARVAVRLMPLPEEHLEESKAEFVERITAMSRLSNPNILAFQGYAYEDGCFVAVFEPAQQTLFERLHSSKAVSGRALTWRERMRVMLAVADALDFLHTAKIGGSVGGGAGDRDKKLGVSYTFRDQLARGLKGEEFNPLGPFIHGDIKSSNVLLTSGARAKLFDALVPRNPEEDPLRSVSAHGSFAYLDPNYADTKALSAASDVYSFGVLLLEVISGRPAMEEDSATLIVMAQDYFILREDYPKLLDPALGVEGGEGEDGSAGPGPGGVPRHELVAMVELVQTCTQVKEDSRPSMAWVKAQMMAALRMGPEEYTASSLAAEQGHGAGASEIEIEMMSEGSPGMPHSSD